MRHHNFRAVILAKPTANTKRRSDKSRKIARAASGLCKNEGPGFRALKELNVPLLHCHREVGTIVGPEIEIEPVADERGGSDNALDKLIAPLKLLQHTHILRLADRIIGVAPDASRRSTRLLLRLQKLARAGAVVREGV